MATWKFFALCIAGAVAVIYVLSATSILLFGAHDPPQDIEIVIPVGTDAAIRSGGRPPVIPNDVEYRQGDTLVVVNEDSATHRLGTWQVGPEQTLEVVLTEATGGSLVCSFHPAKRLDIEVRSEVNLAFALVPALVLGIPAGLAVAGAAQVARRLDDD